MVKSFDGIIADGQRAEREAIAFYSFLLPLIHNGNHRRSILHILNDEKEHLATLKRIQKEMGLHFGYRKETVSLAHTFKRTGRRK